MLGKHSQKIGGAKGILSTLLALIISWGLVSCSDRIEISPLLESQQKSPPVETKVLSEVPPPPVIRELRRSLEIYQPQVRILAPQEDEVFQTTAVNVQFEVKDLPLFKDPELELGPHLHFFLDNEEYQAVYDAQETLLLDDLTPGTHTLRVFASRPWHESFKNDGAYAQTTFHVFAPTGENVPDPNLPLLTSSRPQGSYGAEPIMLDFYLTNAPLHVIAQENEEDNIQDWRIQVTANGQSFLLDSWQPVYLEGFKEGLNWIKLEFVDDQGDIISNTFNSTVRTITYAPNGQDTLSKLVRGEILADEARSIVNPYYEVPEEEEGVVEPIAEEEAVESEVISEEEGVVEPIAEEEAVESEVISEEEVVVEPVAEEEAVESEVISEEEVVVEPIAEEESVESEVISEEEGVVEPVAEEEAVESEVISEEEGVVEPVAEEESVESEVISEEEGVVEPIAEEESVESEVISEEEGVVEPIAEEEAVESEVISEEEGVVEPIAEEESVESEVISEEEGVVEPIAEEEAVESEVISEEEVVVEPVAEEEAVKKISS